jgi:hypothetical protein
MSTATSRRPSLPASAPRAQAQRRIILACQAGRSPGFIGSAEPSAARA